MSGLVILDASVAAKWFLPAADEPLVEEAFGLLRQHTMQDVDFLVRIFFGPR